METFNPEREIETRKSMLIMSSIRLADIFAVIPVLLDWSGRFPKESPIPVMIPFLLMCVWMTDVVIPDDIRPSWLHGSGVRLPGSWNFRCWISVAMHVVMAICTLAVGLSPDGPIPIIMVSAVILILVILSMIVVILKGPSSHMKGVDDDRK